MWFQNPAQLSGGGGRVRGGGSGLDAFPAPGITDPLQCCLMPLPLGAVEVLTGIQERTGQNRKVSLLHL